MKLATTVIALLIFTFQPSFGQKGWVAVDDPFVNLNWISVDFLNDNFGFVVGEQGRIKRTTNGGEDWEFRQSGVDVTLNAVDVVSESVIYAAGFSGTLVKSVDGGDTWTTVSTGGSSETLLDVQFFDEMEGLICGARATLLKTTDGGASWTEQNPRFSKNNVWKIFAFDRSNMYICGNAGSIAHTTNGGENWKKQDSPFGLEIYSISFADTSYGLCIGESGTMLKTTNGGADWAINDPGFPLPTLPFKDVATPDRNHSYICGWNAMLLGQRNGVDWEVQAVPAEYSGTHLTAISFPSPRTGYAVGWDGTILKTVNGGTLPVEQVATSAEKFMLSPLYPNPVASGSDITAEFSIPTRSHVTVRVYNLLGKNVATLAEGLYQAGTYALSLPSSGLPAGMYIVRLVTESDTFSRQLAVRR